MAGENLPVAVEPAIPLESADVPEPDGLSLQSPNLAQQNALATFEAQQVRYKTECPSCLPPCKASLWY